MAKFKDLTGQKFGRLTVIKRVGRSNGQSKHSIWECDCECGNKTNVVSTSLTRGLTRSCKCFLIETAGHNQKQLGKGEASFKLFLASYKKGAKKRDLEWSITEDRFRELTKQNCYYCDQEPKGYIKRTDLNGEYINNGVDRLNNSLGYTLNNSVTCCSMCNWIKGKFHRDEFIEKAILIAKKWNKND